MTDKIDEIMAVVADNVAACERGAFDRIRSALEAALKPGEPDAYLCVDGRWIPADTDRGRALCFRMMTKLGVYTAPPAQTPPRLKVETFKEIAERCDEGQEGVEYVIAYGRDVETAVWKQAGWE